MSGELVGDYLNRLGVTYKIDGDTFKLFQNNLSSLKPIDIIASSAPSFITEWQVLISPLLTQIKGFSSVAEMWYTDRLGHWEELKKMGANYTYLPNRQNRENKPFVVRIDGGTKLKGSQVEAKDLRSGAALIIAGLIAEGETEITGVEHIDRGYERLVERLSNVGAKLFRIEK
jgi:UDP-N-acetylglucosamine 1-carboxyvinyltransferase